MACRTGHPSAIWIARLLRTQPAESNALSRSITSSTSPMTTSTRRTFASTSHNFQEDGETQLSRPPLSTSSRSPASVPSRPIPRYAQTPPRMKAPVSVRRPVTGTRWECNEDPALLDHIYRTVLGDGGDRLLTDEVKWLAVTHKSFDQGRRGFNDRLAFLGRQIVSLQVSLALLNRTDLTLHIPIDQYAASREPFRHPGVDLLPRLTAGARDEVLDQHRIAHLASKMGLLKVVRWKPRDMRNLVKSGSELVLAQALYAIVGAVALQRGGEVAVRIVKDRILSQLGFKS